MQWKLFGSSMQIMAVAIIPVAVSVHTIVSFAFSMAPVPMWHSTMFGPYFVAGAIFSGIAGLIIAMAALRKFLHLETSLHPVHFENLGKLMLMMSLLWTYFVFAERLTTWFGNDTAEMNVFYVTQRGSFSPLYWTMVTCNFVVPFTILALRKLRTIAGCVIASFAVCIGMWLERFLIVVPSLSHKYLPYAWGHHPPQPAEVMITISTFAALPLLYRRFSNIVPIIPICHRHLADAHDGAGVAAADGQYADRRVVAELDRDVRVDDARRHSRDSRDAPRDRRTRAQGPEALRSRGHQRKDPCRRGSPARRRR